MTSNSPSPTSSSSTLHIDRPSYTSPPIPTTRIPRANGNSLQDYRLQSHKGANASAPHSLQPSSIKGAANLSAPTSPPANRSRTYESFWRDHGTNSVSKLLQAQRAASGVNSDLAPLGPPADIIPLQQRSRRTHETNGARPAPPSSIPTTSALSVSSTSSVQSTIPATPPQRQGQAPLLRTPSQKAAMEQDAVETLLFMSSPGHSQQQQQQQQQQRRRIRRERHGDDHNAVRRIEQAKAKAGRVKRVDFEGSRADDSSASSDDYERDKDDSTRVGLGQSRDDAIDRMLDEMSEDESSDGEDMETVRTRVDHGVVNGITRR